MAPALHRRLRVDERDRRGTCEHDLRQGRRVRGLRLPEVACRGVRAPRLPVGVAAAVLPRRVPLRADERAADGLLSTVISCQRCAAARGDCVISSHQLFRGAVRDRGRRGSGRARVRAVGRRGGCEGDRRAAAVRRARRPRAARVGQAGRARGARRRRRV